MSRRNILIAVIVAVLAVAGGAGFYFYQQSQSGDAAPAPAPQAAASAPAAAPAATGPLPAPVFLVLDKSAVLRFSKAGQSITQQMGPILKQAQANILGQRQSLENQAAALKQDSSISDAEREKRFAALEARSQALQVEAQRRQQELSDTMTKANAPLSKAVAEIVPAILKARGANLLLDRSAIAQADPAFDITQEVIAQLDAKLPSVPLPGK